VHPVEADERVVGVVAAAARGVLRRVRRARDLVVDRIEVVEQIVP